MTSYSPFISSGLSAIQHLTPPPSPTQLVRPDSPILPIHDAGTDITDQGPTLTAANPSQAFGAERPKLRKRRSSLTVNTSPLVQLKGSYRAATTATQRQNRSRSGSINDFSQPSSVGLPVEEVKIIGRLRSGSVGNSLRSRRFIRGARPPPSTPLPPLPTIPSSAPHLGNCDLGVDATRRPLVFRTSTLENLKQTVPSPPTVLYPGPPVKATFNGAEDVAMKDN